MSSNLISIQYLNIIYSNLLLREVVFFQENSITKHRYSIKEKPKEGFLSQRKNSFHLKINQRPKLVDKGISQVNFFRIYEYTRINRKKNF